MERRIGILIIIILISCGGEKPSTTASRERTRRVVSSEISPSIPTSDIPITVEITALAVKNPTFQWIVNGVIQDVSSPKLPANYFLKGDTVICIILIDSKESKRIGPIIIENGEPSVQSAWITPDEPKRGTNLNIKANVYDPDDDDVQLLVDWYINDEKKGSGNILQGDKFNAGDEVYAEVTPYDGTNRGLPQKTNLKVIQNTPPEFLSSLPSIKGRSMNYEIRTRDVDGDEVIISLINAPSGMILDGNSLVWEAPELEKDSIFYIEILAKDSRGGETNTSFSLELGRNVEE